MSALMRFLNRDSAAKAVVVTLVSAAAIAAVPNEPASGLPNNAGGLFSAPGRTLVLLDITARRLDGVVGMLDASTRACLAEQGRMLGTEGAGSGKADATRAALDRRAEFLRSDKVGAEAGRTASEMAAEPGLSAGSRERLLHHAGLREACLSWSERSLDTVRAHLGRPGPDLAELKGMAERDVGFVRFVAGVDTDRLDRDAIEAMETNGPRL